MFTTQSSRSATYITRRSGDFMIKIRMSKKIMQNIAFLFYVRENLEGSWKGIKLEQRILSGY